MADFGVEAGFSRLLLKSGLGVEHVPAAISFAGLEEAIDHINRFSSHHTDAIVTEDGDAAERFLRAVDSASALHNASTRFADGFRYGLGAELGISTNRLHSRGPVGLEGLVIYKYVLEGGGHIVGDYSGDNARTYSHRRLNSSWNRGR